MKRGFWDKVPSARIKEEVKRVFPEVESEALDPMRTKKAIIEKVKEYFVWIGERLEEDEWIGTEGWSKKGKHERMAWLVRSGECKWLQDSKEAKKKKHKAMENVFEGCGVEPSERERFKLKFALGESSESESGGESNSEAENVENNN